MALDSKSRQNSSATAFAKRPKQKFWLLLQAPEPELCIKHPGYDEDLVISTDSRTLTLVHLGRLPLADAERQGVWQVDGSPALARGIGTSGGLYSRFAAIRPVRGPVTAQARENRADRVSGAL